MGQLGFFPSTLIDLFFLQNTVALSIPLTAIISSLNYLSCPWPSSEEVFVKSQESNLDHGEGS